jgi:hypothetical protein
MMGLFSTIRKNFILLVFFLSNALLIISWLIHHISGGCAGKLVVPKP